MYDIFEECRETITLHYTLWVKSNKSIWKGKVIRIPCSHIPCDTHFLKIKLLDNKTEYIVLIKNVSLEYMKKIVPITRHNYSSGYHMEESVHGLMIKIKNIYKTIG